MVTTSSGSQNDCGCILHNLCYDVLQPTSTTPKPETTPNYPIYVGKYDYESRTDTDMGFKKGDLMYIISTDEGDWWFAHSKNGGREGYIPSNYVAEYKPLDAEE